MVDPLSGEVSNVQCGIVVPCHECVILACRAWAIATDQTPVHLVACRLPLHLEVLQLVLLAGVMYLRCFEFVDQYSAKALPNEPAKTNSRCGHEMLHLGSSAPIPIGDNRVATERSRDVVKELRFAACAYTPSIGAS
jgi:hypothetical protein